MLPQRTPNSTKAEHLQDHNTLHAWYNEMLEEPDGGGATDLTSYTGPSVSIVTPDGLLEIYATGTIDLVADTTLNLTAGTGEIQFTDGSGTITLSEIRTDLSGLIVANRQTGNYTLVLSDKSKVVEMNVAGANTLTVPPNSSVAFPVGTVLEGVQYGAGQTTISPGAGVTIRSSGGKLKTAAQYAQFTLRKIATDEWIAAGELST